MRTRLGRAVGLQKTQETGDTLNEGLATDEPHGRIGTHLMGEMFAGPEADLEPEVANRRREQPVQVDLSLRVFG